LDISSVNIHEETIHQFGKIFFANITVFSYF
jgi:hypothetical protein